MKAFVEQYYSRDGENWFGERVVMEKPDATICWAGSRALGYEGFLRLRYPPGKSLVHAPSRHQTDAVHSLSRRKQALLPQREARARLPMGAVGLR
jgi:hypothetical protein